MASTGRQQANTVAGEEIVFRNDKKKIKEVEGVVPPEQKIVAPLFNLVGYDFPGLFDGPNDS